MARSFESPVNFKPLVVAITAKVALVCAETNDVVGTLEVELEPKVSRSFGGTTIRSSSAALDEALSSVQNAVEERYRGNC